MPEKMNVKFHKITSYTHEIFRILPVILITILSTPPNEILPEP